MRAVAFGDSPRDLPLVLLLLEGRAGSICRGCSGAGTDGNLTCRAVSVAIVVFTVTDIAANALDMLLLRGAAVRGTFFHLNLLPYHLL